MNTSHPKRHIPLDGEVQDSKGNTTDPGKEYDTWPDGTRMEVIKKSKPDEEWITVKAAKFYWNGIQSFFKPNEQPFLSNVNIAGSLFGYYNKGTNQKTGKNTTSAKQNSVQKKQAGSKQHVQQSWWQQLTSCNLQCQWDNLTRKDTKQKTTNQKLQNKQPASLVSECNWFTKIFGCKPTILPTAKNTPPQRKMQQQASKQTSDHETQKSVEVPASDEDWGDTGFKSTFKDDPHGKTVPPKAQEVYQWAPNGFWDPDHNKRGYLQCTAYTKMVWNTNGHNTQNILKGDARDWIYDPNVNAYQFGKTGEEPRPLDALVWASGNDNHVAIVTDVEKTEKDGTIIYSVHYSQSNSDIKEADLIIVKEKSGAEHITASTQGIFKPSHFIRLK